MTMLRTRRCIVLLPLFALTACQASAFSGGAVSTASMAAPTETAASTEIAAPAAPTVALVLDEGRTHSAAAATAMAEAALDLAAYPPGAVRLAHRPPAGQPLTGATYGASSQVVRTRWESVPGTVADVAAWMVAHAAPGTGIVNTRSGDSADLGWTTARAGHPYNFDLAAWLAPDGDHVDVTLTADVIWTPPRTSIETIPASVHSGFLDHREGGNTFGMSSRHVLTSVDLDQLRAEINSMGTRAPGARSCPEDFGDLVTITMTYGGHRVVMTMLGDNCGATSVTSDGHQQPALEGAPLDVVDRIDAAVTPAPPGDVAPESLLRNIFRKADAQARAVTLAGLVPLPWGSRWVPAPTSLYWGPDVAVALRTATVAGSVDRTVSRLVAKVPHGFVVAHVGLERSGGTAVVLQPAHVMPASIRITVHVTAVAEGTQLQVLGEALWLTPRSPHELVPPRASSARVTIWGADHRMTRVELTGAALRPITQALDTSAPARAGVSSCSGRPAPDPLKLEVRYTVGGHVVLFYWSPGDCPVTATVDGQRATDLTDPPTALVERALHWQKG